MAAYLRRTDQDLERTAKAAAPAGYDLVMHSLCAEVISVELISR